MAEAIDAGASGSPLQTTDPTAAEDVSLGSLERDEALALLNGVFEAPVEETVGIYDELQQAKLLSPTVAVLPESGTQSQVTTEEDPEAAGENREQAAGVEVSSGRDEAAEALPEAEARKDEGPPAKQPAEVAKASLLDSTIPLEVGAGETLDLTLKRQDGHLEPSAPLVQAKIPAELGEKIELPEVGIGIEVADVATQRTASISDGHVAFYPNVAEDSDLAITPTPAGVETLTQLRSAESPEVETYRFSLPPGAELVATDEGGAEVREGQQAPLVVPPPTALDAQGDPVPVDLTVSGTTLRIRADVKEARSFPVLVDPLFQTYEWAAKNNSAGICSNSFQQESFYSCNNREEWGYEVFTHYGLSPAHMQAGNHEFSIASPPGIAIKAELAQTAGDHATVLYTVPRYFKDSTPPTSFIKSLKLTDVKWRAQGESASPYLFMGIWDSTIPGWVNYYTESGHTGHGLSNTEYLYNFEDKFTGASVFDHEAKAAEVSVNATENTAQSNAEVYVGAATVELGDEGAPKPPQPVPQTQWVNQSAPAIAFTATDYGLGAYSISASTEEVDSKGKPLHTWTARNGCVGVGDAACPQTWESPQTGQQALTYEPALLPSGIHSLSLVAEDPLGNKSSTGLEEVRVDHIAPTLNLAGSMTEQDLLGTRRASYALKAIGTDGNAEHPQSGITKAEVKLDGKAVVMEGKQAEEWSPKCTTQNCGLSAEWTLSTAGLAEGKHTVEVTAADAVGLSATKTLVIETRSAAAPSLSLSGSATEQGTLGTSRPRYVLKAKSTANAAGFEVPTLGATPTFSSSLESFNGGQDFLIPADVATDAAGDVWVLDNAYSRLSEFNEKGEWLRNAGGPGAAAGKLSSPAGLVADSKGNVWVADAGNNRIVEFNEKGEFLETFGTNVNKTKVEAAGTAAEKNLCTAASGNVCQAATAGGEAGQLRSPKGIAITSANGIWVADTGNNRLEKFNVNGVLASSLSGEGTETGKLKAPSAITVAPDGSIWVADTGNNRIEQWSSTLTFVRAVGKEGTGSGEFKRPTAIDADSSGEIWVGDSQNNRIEEFDEWGTYLGQFGTPGTGSGQFNMGPLVGIAVDPKGSIWVTDGNRFRVQHWVIPGFPTYSSSIQYFHSEEFITPVSVATDASGNLWVLDKSLTRLSEFNEKGEWVRNVGGSGSGAGKLSGPSALATDSKGNLWVADTVNNRIVEFNGNGEFVLTFGAGVNKTKVEAAGTEAEKNLCTAASGNVCQAGTAGSVAGQLKAPRGIAVTSGGNLWVADSGNNRLEKFSPSGSLLNNISGEGTEPGKLKEPAAITVAPDGSIWVADTGNNRIQQWNPNLTFVRAIGKEGSGGGEFKTPYAIFADPSGNIWVADQKNNRIEEFGEGGRYLGEFGANGSGKFGSPSGIAVDSSGSIWVADTGHLKVQKWTQQVPRSEITTILWVDGAQQTGLHGTCKTASCTIEPWWTVESLALAPGAHTARVKTTDGLGRSTENTINFSIARDTTKPNLEASGELVNAPEGWVEQETYGLNATATDAGFGVTSISFKIDGQQVASASQSCSAGGCQETLSKQISMASYAGGAHSAEIIATDGAGNATVRRWTINVDPEGHISTKEAEATLEAVESTTEEAPIASNKDLLEPEQIELGDNPELRQSGSAITSTGAPDTTTMTTNLAAGITISSPYGETTIVPVVSEAASPTSIVEGAAGVSANASAEADSIIRPEYNGVETFQAIRSETSPEKYSWNVHLYEGQKLHLIDSHYAEVLYESGKRSFLITAEQAHDATGKEVPTSLEVSGNVLTLTVEFHKGTFVYPILAGAGWETSYRVPVLIEGPENELEIQQREQAEQAESEASPPPPPPSGKFSEVEAAKVIASGPVAEEIIPAPEPPSGTASASSVPEKTVKPFRLCAKSTCNYWHVELHNPSYFYQHQSGNHWASWWESGTEVHSDWWSNPIYWPELEVQGWGCGVTGPLLVYAGEHKHLTAWARYKIVATAFTPEGDTGEKVNDQGLQIWVWPNGDQQRVKTQFDETVEAYETAIGCHH
ncbi:MAG TPA: NHL repeat-containing protein [Solirubrobacterales bacterium]|nr:NHL repeat-containing protein [Solirubrobacterales bacterium]